MFFRIREFDNRQWIYGSMIYYSDPNLSHLQAEAFPPSVRVLSDIDRYCCSNIGIPFTFIPAINLESPEAPKIIFGSLKSKDSGQKIFKSGPKTYEVDDKNEMLLQLRAQLEAAIDFNDNNTNSENPKMFHLQMTTSSSGASIAALNFSTFRDKSKIASSKDIAISWIEGLHFHYYRITSYIIYLIISNGLVKDKKQCLKEALANISENYQLNSISQQSKIKGNDKLNITGDYWLYFAPSKPRSILSFIESLWNDKYPDMTLLLDIYCGKHPYLAGFYLAKLTDIGNNIVLIQYFDVYGMKEYTVQPIISGSISTIETQYDPVVSLSDEVSVWSEREYLYPTRQFFTPFGNSFGNCKSNKTSFVSLGKSFKFEVVKNVFSKDQYIQWCQNAFQPGTEYLSLDLSRKLHSIASQQKDFLQVWNLEGRIKKAVKDTRKSRRAIVAGRNATKKSKVKKLS